jgi:hypothetical protein
MLSISNFIFAQADLKLQQITPKWKLGDQKIIYNKSSTKVFVKDSLINNTEAIANYSLKVVDTFNNYTLSYANETNSINIVSKSSIREIDSAGNILTDIIKKIEKETNSFKYELIVDKQTGQATKVKNSDKLLKTVEKITLKLMVEFGKKMSTSNMQMDSLKGKVMAYFKMSEPKILETILNEYNYIMQAYAYEFPYNGSISQKTMVHDVNALGIFGNLEVPAVVTIGSKKTNNILTIETDTDYDKNFLLEQIKKQFNNMSSLKTSDIFLSEKTESIFTIRNGWIVSHKSNVIFQTKEVKVINETSVSFQ